MQVVDVNGNMFGDGALEVTASNGKPKVPVINTDITIGTTPIVSGTVGRVLFQGIGNVVQESANLSWNQTTNILNVGGDIYFGWANRTLSVSAPSGSGNGGSLNLIGGNATTSGTGGAINIYGGIGAGGGGRGAINIGQIGYSTVNLGGYVYVNNSGPNTGTAFQVGAGGQNGLSIYWDNLTPFMQYGLVSGRQARFVNSSSYTFSSKVFIGTNVDAGFTFDVNGTARVKDVGSELSITSPLSAIAPVIFTTKGASGGYRGGYNFKGGFGGNAGNTIFIIDTTNTDAGSRGGFGNFLFSDLAAAKFTIDNTQSGGRNAALRLRGNFANNFTEYNGIDFNAYTGTDIGGFIGSQRNSASSGFGADIVVLATLDSAPSTYLEVARFIGRYNSFYVGTDKTLAVPSAKMQVESTTKGFLPPRMTTTQKNAITTPAAGLVVYDTTLNKLCVYTTAWETITSI